jgi:AP-4 complex subunit mu-1
MEVLDEFLDYGCVQLSTTGKLKPYIMSEPVTLRHVEGQVPSLFGIENRVAPCNAADRPVIRSRLEQEPIKNEVYIDIIERLMVTVAADGRIVRSELHGEVKMKSFLVGSPVIKLSMNGDINISDGELASQPTTGYGKVANLDNCRLHDHVKLENSRTLSIQPPEGEFTVMTYSVAGVFSFSLPFRVQSYVKDNGLSSRDIELSLRLQCDISTHSRAVNVTLRIPVPLTTTGLSQQLSGVHRGHTAQLLQTPSHKSLEWKLPEVQSKSEETAHFQLIGAKDGKSNGQEFGPIAIDFEISGYVCSNVQIRSVQVFDRQHSYAPMKWLRYITTADSYIVKLI